jgi:PPOX class probable F420-dependent enzyme
MSEMSEAEWRAFVGHGTRTGKLATVRHNGQPHVAPVGFLVNGENILFFTGPNTVKGRALRHEPRFALCVDDEVPPFSFVIIEAEAHIIDDRDQMLTWAQRIAARYMGEERAKEYAALSAELGELLVCGRITKVIARADLAH